MATLSESAPFAISSNKISTDADRPRLARGVAGRHADGLRRRRRCREHRRVQTRWCGGRRSGVLALQARNVHHRPGKTGTVNAKCLVRLPKIWHFVSASGTRDGHVDFQKQAATSPTPAEGWAPNGGLCAGPTGRFRAARSVQRLSAQGRYASLRTSRLTSRIAAFTCRSAGSVPWFHRSRCLRPPPARHRGGGPLLESVAGLERSRWCSSSAVRSRRDNRSLTPL